MTANRKQQVLYLAKVVAGLIVVFGAVLITQLLSHQNTDRSVVSGLPILAFIAIGVFIGFAPYLNRLYQNQDELGKNLHNQASGISLVLLFILMGITGVVQSIGWLPSFNAVWGCLIIIAIWGVMVMLRDMHYR